MRIALAMIVLAVSTSEAAAQVKAERMFATIRSSDSTRVATMSVDISGRLFESLGVAKGTTGSLHLGGNANTATGSIEGTLSTEPGALTFTAAADSPELEVTVWPQSGARTPRLFAKGKSLRIVRHPNGDIRVLTL